jgi:hypothetical protein
MSTQGPEQPKTEDKRCDGFQKYISFLRTPECNAKIEEDKKKEEAGRELTNVTPVDTSKLPPVDASTTTAKETPVANSSEQQKTPSGPAASGQPAAPTRGGWFSRGGKRKSKAKKSRRKNRKQRKSRKNRK